MRMPIQVAAAFGMAGVLLAGSSAVAQAGGTGTPQTGVPRLTPVAETEHSARACGDTGANRDHGAFVTYRGRSFNLRSGPSTACTIRDVIRSGDQLDYYCWSVGEGGTWTYLRVRNTGFRGWSKDSILPGNGAAVTARC
ncbi:SH3 domain-containing protein [Luedemannella flava]|uniref:SH3 domain-containing protein n=1 Tax=Luedemannella flava TaxID=349316 RepID=A0ABN2M086_9ACTN